MRKDYESASTSRPFDLTIVNRSLVLLLIVCFAGCATGSCLSYGHSCWGAHGKRSYVGRSAQQQQRPIDNHSDVGLVGKVETNGNAPAPSKQGRWILSRLVTGRLTVPAPVLAAGDRRASNTWYGTQKLLALPGNWDTDYDSTRNEIFRDQKMKTNVARIKDSIESNEDNKEFDDPYDLTQKIADSNTETDVFFVPSRREYDDRPSRTRRINILKILDDSSSDNKLK